MLSAWKLRREFSRLGQQLKGLAERFTDPAHQRRLDALVQAGLPQIQGTRPLGARVALVLLFQPKGIAQSTLECCQWLAEAGYAPLIVSNAPLLPQDHARLAPVIWRAVVRPNFGYDFGGYRDGLTCLAQWGITPEELLILNDSIWLPSLPQSDILERLARDPAEIAGSILRRRGRERFLESYLYRIRASALRHPAFSAYWRGLRLTSNKYHVIRRGERGFSAAMIAAGLRLSALYDAEGLPARIAAQHEAFLRRMLTYGAYIDPHLATERDALLAQNGPEWHAQVQAHVARVLEKRQAYSSFPYAMVQLEQYPFLKKSAEPVSRSWLRAHLAAIEAGDLPAPSPAILAEIRTRCSS